MESTMRFLLLSISCLFIVGGCQDQSTRAQSDPYDSGGPLMVEQAAFDVTFYDLDLFVQPADSSINGVLTVEALITIPTEWLVLDLDPLLVIESVTMTGPAGAEERLTYKRDGGKVWIDFPMMKQPGDHARIAVSYGGRPRVAPNPPWNGGFTWGRTSSGEPWIATTCQQIGADVWWPVKDHPSDEPDSMALHITVPEQLVVASNGRLRGVESRIPSTRTYHWFTSTPINVYNVALNIAPYRAIENTYESVTGETIPVVFYVLPEDEENGIRFMSEIKDHLRFYEETVGPYPFRIDKYGVAQTPHLGMEHQTIIAYGAGFSNGSMTGGRDWGFDALHHHELSHEWFGNVVTNADWSDMWIHEGFGSYMQPLYKEYLDGAEGYHAYIASQRRNIRNNHPVAPRGSLSSSQIYGGDIYYKGSLILHTMRYLIGEDKLRTLLRRVIYPDPAMELITDGKQCRFATTDDILYLAEQVSGMDLDWFFEVYLRQADLPELVTQRQGNTLQLRWETPEDLPFFMPLDVQLGDEIRRIEMPDRQASLLIPEGVEPVIDPQKWVLRAE